MVLTALAAFVVLAVVLTAFDVRAVFVTDFLAVFAVFVVRPPDAVLRVRVVLRFALGVGACASPA